MSRGSYRSYRALPHPGSLRPTARQWREFGCRRPADLRSSPQPIERDQSAIHHCGEMPMCRPSGRTSCFHRRDESPTSASPADHRLCLSCPGVGSVCRHDVARANLGLRRRCRSRRLLHRSGDQHVEYLESFVVRKLLLRLVDAEDPCSLLVKTRVAAPAARRCAWWEAPPPPRPNDRQPHRRGRPRPQARASPPPPPAKENGPRRRSPEQPQNPTRISSLFLTCT